MRKLKISWIVFLSCAAVCLCAMLVLALSGDGGGFWGMLGVNVEGEWHANYELVLEKEISAVDIRRLTIDYGMTFNDVFFYQGEGESIVIREYMNFTPKENQISRIEEKGGELAVRGVRRNFFLFFSIPSRNAYTEIYLPEGCARQLEEVHVKTVSGDISSELSFKVGKGFGAYSTSGDLYLPEVEAGEVQISSTSGNIRMTAALAEKVSLSTTSGDMALERTKGDIRISSTSGNIVLTRVQGNVNVSTTSGDISLGHVEGDMDISTTSGFIRLEEGTGRFEGDSVSGDIRVEKLDGTFQMDTTSGDVSLIEGSGWGKAGTVSGDVKLFLDSLGGNLTAYTTSGNVDLELPKETSLTLDFDSTSGECTTFFDEQLQFNKRGNQAEGKYNGGENRIDVSTVSGDLRITEH